MCKIVGGEGTASLVMIPALVWKISQENERGGGLEIAPPPVGRGLKYLYKYQIGMCVNVLSVYIPTG